MKVVLAGCENWYFAELALLAGCKNILFSYHYMKDKPQKEYDKFFDLLTNDIEVICDSGLFTLMFGAGKGATHSLSSMTAYTKSYIDFSKKYPHKNLTIVEADVHKLLGMPAVYELRKHFENSGMRVLYTWHIEEGIEGLYKLAEKYDYVALSVPELRILFKGKGRYQDGVLDLLNKIKRNVKKIPKIHLLGNTVQETMETNLAYSCDSTSWLSGCRYGRFARYENGKIKMAALNGKEFEAGIHILRDHFKDSYEEIMKYKDKGDKQILYKITAYLSAFAYVQYQHWLNKNYKFEGESEWK